MLKIDLPQFLDRIEIALPPKVADLLFRFQCKALRAISFVMPAPEIDGIPQSEQEHNLRNLICLKLRRAGGENLSFSEMKRLNLSDAADFRNNTRLFSLGKLEIDEEVRELSNVLNRKEYIFTLGSCSGHLEEDGEFIIFNDTGFISFKANPDDPRLERFLADLEVFCLEESRKDADSVYSLESFEGEIGLTFAISWRWNHPLYEKERELIKKWTDDSYDGTEESYRQERFELEEQQRGVSHLAKTLGIHEKHMAFVERLKDFIENYGNQS